MKIMMEIDLKGPDDDVPLERYELPEFDLLYYLGCALQGQWFEVHGLVVQIAGSRPIASREDAT